MKAKTNTLMVVAQVLFAIAVTFSSCKTNAQTDMCYVNDPMELEWLLDVIQRQKHLNVDRKADIYEYTYQNEKYFKADMCVGCPDFIVVVYNCKGDVVCQSGGIMGGSNCPEFEEVAIDRRLIWSSYQDVK